MGELRTASADEIGVSVKEIADFYERHWPRKMCLSLPGFARWQFLEPPEQHGRCSVCVTVSGSKLLGVMGLHERAFNLNGASSTGAELTTWIVSPESKGQGIGPRMLDYLQSRYDVLLGSGISDEALNVYLRKGFNYWRSIPRYFRVFDIDAVRPYSRVDALGGKLAEHRKRFIKPDGGDVERIAAASVPFPDRGLVDLNGYVRTPAHLSWRFDRHPVYDYETYLIEGGAYVVLRRDEVPGMRFAHVVEFGAFRHEMPRLISFLDFYACQHGLAAMDVTCTSSAFGGCFIGAGWFSSVDEPMFSFLNLFHPPELRDPQTTSLIYWGGIVHGDLADLGCLHVVKGDLDLDRPTIHYYDVKGIEKE